MCLVGLAGSGALCFGLQKLALKSSDMRNLTEQISRIRVEPNLVGPIYNHPVKRNSKFINIRRFKNSLAFSFEHEVECKGLRDSKT